MRRRQTIIKGYKKVLDHIQKQHLRQSRRVIIVGATSGIGREVAVQLRNKGWLIGVAGRRLEALQALKAEAPEQTEILAMDVTCPEAPALLQTLADRMGGMDVFLLSAGIGHQNPSLDPSVELDTLRTNAEGFTRMVTAAYRYFRQQGGGRIAVISSIAGTKGLGAAPAYSATKRFQNTYIEALAQLAHMEGVDIRFTDIRPGFVDTDLLNGNYKYPMLMKPQVVARHIVHAIEKKKRVAVIDFRYRLLVAGWKLIPRWIWERMRVK